MAGRNELCRCGSGAKAKSSGCGARRFFAAPRGRAQRRRLPPEAGASAQDSFVEACDLDILDSARLGVDCGGERIGIRQREIHLRAYRGRAPGKRHIHRDRLDAEPDEHLSHVALFAGAKRPDQDLRVFDRAEQSPRPRSEGLPHPLDGAIVMNVARTQQGDQDIAGNTTTATCVQVVGG